ncbi:MAG: restriction endonuclease subunit S [Candidatus Eisenbacteria bacterium]|nr:restriction endonuclease subunit S [Planctomycetota bacterium]MCC6653220.1 restriction endonuclease subunit S [Candidatus Eisenbacteria bacterium]
MGADWQTLTLEDAAVALIDCEHKTPPAAPVGFPYVAIPQLKHGRLELSEARKISPHHLIEWTRRAKPQQHDIILSRRCNPGETAVVPVGVECAVGQNLVLLRANGKRVFPPFLRWLVRSPAWWGQVGKFLNVGAVFDSLRCADVPRFELPIPPLGEQRAIAHILGTLDDKIELNRRTNETLEAMARALFKSWFVDFDPVRAKAAGKQPSGMDAATAALFPSEFVESEIGEIPKGWQVALIGDVGACIRDGVDPAAVPPDTPYIGLEHMPQRSIALGAWSRAAAAQSQKARYKQGDVLFGKLRPYFHKVGIAPNDGVCSTDIVVVRPYPDRLGLALGHLSSSEFIAFTNAGSEGTRMPRTSWTRMSSYPIALPEASTSAALDRHVLPLVAEIRASLFEAAQLATLRDALLPRLLSGELRIPDAERIAASAP